MRNFFNKYPNADDRISVLKSIISLDPIYVELTKYDEKNNKRIFSHADIAFSASNFMEYYFDNDLLNPIVSNSGDKFYFQPDPEHIKREGRRNAGAKYAAHFVTAGNQNKKRHYDTSKVIAYTFIKDGLKQPDYRLEKVNDKGIKTVNIFYKYSAIHFMEIICREDPQSGTGLFRAIAFAPNKTEKYVLKNLSPLEAGIKPHD